MRKKTAPVETHEMRHTQFFEVNEMVRQKA